MDAGEATSVVASDNPHVRVGTDTFGVFNKDVCVEASTSGGTALGLTSATLSEGSGHVMVMGDCIPKLSRDVMKLLAARMERWTSCIFWRTNAAVGLLWVWL